MFLLSILHEVVCLLEHLPDYLELLLVGGRHEEFHVGRVWLVEGSRVREDHWQVVVGISQLAVAVSVGAVLAELAVPCLIEVLAALGLVVVVGDVEHLHLDVAG